MIRALIFDFNGVLADDDPIHMQAFREVAREEGLAFTDEEYLDEYLPLNDWDCFKTAVRKAFHVLRPAAKLDELIRRKSVYYFRAIAGKSVMFSAATTAVQAAAGRCPLATASGAKIDEIRHILNGAGLHGLFQGYWPSAAEDVGIGKPHPEPFLRALDGLKDSEPSLKASECVAIEDSIGGIQSAHEADMRCLCGGTFYDLATACAPRIRNGS